MSKVVVRKPFTMDLTEVRTGLEKLAQGLANEQGMKYQWKGDDRVEFSHKTAKGFIEIQGSELLLELKLSLLYAAMSSVVKNKIIALADEYIS